MSLSAASSGPLEVVIIGASLAGLFAAAAAVAAGARTTIIERDILPETSLARKGVPQGRQPHVLLHRGLLAAEKLVPGIREDLLNHGAVPFDTGTMAWLGEYGWLPTWIPAYETVSATRPLLEQLVREKVRNLAGVTLREGLRVTELQHDAHGWWVVCDDGGSVRADVVIDASGRGSRLPHWLAELGVGVPEPLLVDARLGYACQAYRANGTPPIEIGVVIQATPQTGRGALALPVEDGHWLVVAVGYGDRRPTRDPTEFDQFLTALPDPAIAELAQQLEPVGDVAIHRQTGNRRHRYGRSRSWPAGLLSVGDAYCAFNPVFGQGITVAACQALLIRDALKHDSSRAERGPLETRRLQRRIWCRGRLSLAGRHYRGSAPSEQLGLPAEGTAALRSVDHSASAARRTRRSRCVPCLCPRLPPDGRARDAVPPVAAHFCWPGCHTGNARAESAAPRVGRAGAEPVGIGRCQGCLARLVHAHPGRR